MNYNISVLLFSKMSILELPDPLSSPRIADFNIICRICLRKGGCDGVVCVQPIGAYIDRLNPEKEQDLYEKIRMCSNIELHHNDDVLPNNICDNCVNLLFIAHYFKQLTANSDSILRRIVNNMQDEHPVTGVKMEWDFSHENDDYVEDGDDDPIHFNFAEQIYLNPTKNEYCESNEHSIFICDICNVEFRDKSSLSDHIRLDHLSKTQNSKYTTSQLDIEDDNTPLDSKKTIKLFRKQSKLRKKNTKLSEIRRKKTVINGKKIGEIEDTGYYECLVCNTTFGCKEDLSKHMYSHENLGKYKCYGCDVVFDKYSKRTHHEKYCCPNMPPGTKYECRNCKVKCDNRFRFDVHIKSDCTHKEATGVKTIELKPLLKCEHCVFTTMSKWNLNYHVLNCHTEDKPHVCEICGKSYAIGWRLTKHYKQSHQPKEKKYKCTHCSYATVDPSSLRVHNRRHTLEYRFSCDVCGASFKHSSGYHSHVRRYHREKEQQCEFCKRMFSLKASLKSHIASVHLGIKPFACKDCGVAFSRKRSLKDHLLKVHKIVDGTMSACEAN